MSAREWERTWPIVLVSLTDECVLLRQPTGIPDGEDAEVLIDPDQIDVVVGWLHEAREELRRRKGETS